MSEIHLLKKEITEKLAEATNKVGYYITHLEIDVLPEEEGGWLIIKGSGLERNNED